MIRDNQYSPSDTMQGQGEDTVNYTNSQGVTGDLWGEFNDEIKKLNQQKAKTSATSNGHEHINFKPDREYHDERTVWPTPRTLEKPLLPVLPLTDEMIPESLRPWLTDIQYRMRCPVDYLASAAVVMISSLIGTRLAIKPKTRDSWTIIPNLWGAVIGDPSSLKTPSVQEAFAPLNRLVVASMANHEDALAEYERDLIEYEAKKKAYKYQKDLEAKGKSVDFSAEYPEPPVKPKERRYMTNDATVEKLAELLEENPTGLLQFRDELIGLLAGWDKSGREGDRAFYLEAWNGNGRITVDRIGRGTLHIKRICISLFGAIQPTKLLGYLKAAQGFENDGFVQRLQLAVYPDKPEWSYVDQYPDTRARDAAFDLIQQIADSDFSEFGWCIDEYNDFPYTRFDDEAQQVFIDWLTHWEKEVLPNENGLVLEHFVKYRSLIPALALVFHVADSLANPVAVSGTEKRLVSKQAIDRALLWCEYLMSHARRIYGLLDGLSVAAAKELLRHIRIGDLKDEFKVRDVVRKGWSNLNTNDLVECALEELQEQGWILPMKPKESQNGRPEATQYKIHPKIISKT
ncbi:YfjI family protein [Larkinella terrae]|uniref:DUF3987 domain-containing protein n=1 Tax=Larkinella terrae TaxID=2025311 RepID=A0A7K0EIL0_9BACT|nr:YfjI family protein [Larkinella terrae]MRS61680.1 DUF3987 domain-containing protein [Larkinella terrae]